MKNHKKKMAFLMIIGLIAVSPAMAVQQDDVTVDIISPEQDENVTVTTGLLSSGLPVEYEVDNSNNTDGTQSWTETNITLQLEDSSGNAENYTVRENYNLTASETLSETYTASDTGTLEYGEDWTATVFVESDQTFTVSDSNTFSVFKQNLMNLIISVIMILVVLVVIGKVIERAEDI